ncbi:MAG: response regulator [Candidatus Woesearchaeota archaeon]
MKDKLDILIVEDNKLHLKGIKTLTDAGHRVDIARNFVEATHKLGWSGKRGSQPETSYGAVLTDLFFPMGGRENQFATIFDKENERHIENPFGYSVALYAAKQGVPNIAILTDQNHHGGPIVASFDLFYGEIQKDGKRSRFAFNVGESKFMMFDIRDHRALYECPNGNIVRLEGNDQYGYNLPKEHGGEFPRTEDGYKQLKDWESVLDTLLSKQ